MLDVKRLYQSLNFLGTVSLAVTLPVIIYRVFKAVYLKKGYNALTGKVLQAIKYSEMRRFCICNVGCSDNGG